MRPAAESPPLAGIDIVGSDHSPAPLAMKQDADFFKVWGGIAGVQHTLPVLLELAAPARVAELTAGNPAERFGLPRKGRLAVGYDADFTLVDLGSKSADFTASYIAPNQFRHEIKEYGRSAGSRSSIRQ